MLAATARKLTLVKPAKTEDMEDIVGRAVADDMKRKLESWSDPDDTGVAVQVIDLASPSPPPACPHLRALKGWIANPDQLFAGLAEDHPWLAGGREGRR